VDWEVAAVAQEATRADARSEGRNLIPHSRVNHAA
jgi:hypothetical protein